MAEPQLTFTRLAGSGRGRLLVVGPSLGTSVAALWSAAAAHLADDYEVVGWDLPGHGRGAPATAPFTVAELAAAVRRRLTTDVLGERDGATYAGVSLAGAVALELAGDPGAFVHVSCIASAARIGEPDAWRERAELVRRAGTPAMVGPSSRRWFADGFLERDPTTGNRLLLSLSDTDRESYALACEALAEFDLHPRLADTRVPLLVAPGELDIVVPPELAARTADAAPGAVFRILPGCGHLPPAEAPRVVAEALRAAHPIEESHD